MATTVKRICVALNKAELRELSELCALLEITQSALIKRAILTLYNQHQIAKTSENFNCDSK